MASHLNKAHTDVSMCHGVSILLSCLAQGKTNREIGHALLISEQTVKNHITEINKRLSVSRRIQAVLKALSNGWIAFPEPDLTADKSLLVA
jgi:ATP/maltotriose-dependent transcriptional regulator MalT